MNVTAKEPKKQTCAENLHDYINEYNAALITEASKALCRAWTATEQRSDAWGKVEFTFSDKSTLCLTIQRRG